MVNCPRCTFSLGPNARQCGICGFILVKQIINWKTKEGTFDIAVSSIYEEKWKIHEPYEHLIENSRVYFNPDHPVMTISTSLGDEVLRAYCRNLADPTCCVRRLIVNGRPSEDILQAIEANHSITALHIHSHLDDADIQRALKHKDLHVLTVNGALLELNHSPEHGIVATRTPYSELGVWKGNTSFVQIDPEPFLKEASKLSSLNFFVSESSPTLVQVLFSQFATFPQLTKLSIGIGADDATVPVFWTAATEFVKKSPFIRKFGVRCDGIAHPAMCLLLREMAGNTRITHFSISCNIVTEEICREVAAMLTANTHLKRFKLESRYAFSGQQSIIADAIKANKALKKITLLGCGDCYDYLTALLENNSITSFRADSWDCTVNHCQVIAQILKKNIIQKIAIPMRFAVDEAEIYEALKSNTSLRTFHLNVVVHPLFAEKRLKSVQFAPFNITQLNTAIEIFNLKPQSCYYMKLGFDEEMSLISTANELLAEKVRARTQLFRYWAVYALQTLQLFTAADLGLLASVPAEVRRLIIRFAVPAYVVNEKQFAFISSFATREKLQELVQIHRSLDLSAYDDLAENFLYNLLLLVE